MDGLALLAATDGTMWDRLRWWEGKHRVREAPGHMVEALMRVVSTRNVQLRAKCRAATPATPATPTKVTWTKRATFKL
jgi:hypothetical protein